MKEMSSKTILEKGFSGAVHQYIAAIINGILGFFITVFIIRNLTISDYGIYNFLLSIVFLAMVITSFGLAPIIQRYLPEYREKKNTYVQKKIMTIALVIRFIAACVFIIILLLCTDKIMDIFHLPDYAENTFPVIAIIILFVLESQLLGDAFLPSLFKNKYWNLSRLLYSITKFTLFYFAISFDYGVMGIVWAWLIAELIIFVLFSIKAYQIIFSHSVKKEDIIKIPFKRFINFGKFLYFYNLGYIFRDIAMDIFLLAYFIGSQAVGLYSFAYGIPFLIMSFSPGSRLRAVLYPLITRQYIRTGKQDDLVYYFRLINSIIFFSMVPIFIILMILADKIILYVFNPEYILIVNLFILSSGFLMIQQFLFPYLPILFTLEKGRLLFVGTTISVYNLVMDIILIPTYGVVGAIIATGSAGIFLLLYYNLAIKKTIHLQYPWRSFSKFSLNILITVLVVLVMRELIYDILSLVFVLMVGGFVYLLSSYINKGFEEKDRNVLNDAIGRRIWIF